jgi:serine/threonine protein kinase
MREARMLHRLADPAIIGVRDCDYADPDHRGRAYIVMEYFPGQSLQTYVEQHGPLSPDDVLVIARQVARAMEAAHARGIYHRDLTPSNVLIRKEGETWSVKIIDFGLAMGHQFIEAALTESRHDKSMLTTTIAGTLSYAPPEQLGRLTGAEVGPHSDVYSFARTCCYALFKQPLPNLEQWETVPEPLAELLGECVREVPGERPQGFQHVRWVLEPGSWGLE